MRVGRFLRGGRPLPFLTTDSLTAVPWQALDTDSVPSDVRDVVCQALATGDDVDFLAALDPLEDYVSSKPDFLAKAGKSSDIHIGKAAGLCPPVRPRNFFCVGLNYLDHARESKMDLPARPLLFAKTSNALLGHGYGVRIPSGATQLDYEAELAVVIGRTCRHATVANALEFVAGYTCVNDISARDFQFADGQWYRGKSCDGFGPLGPWMVTKSDIPDPLALSIRCRVNGNTMQDSTTANLIFGVPELVSFISSGITLEPGDVIATGTPPGVGFARKPPVYLKPGDVVEVDIQNIGVLRNVIEDEMGNRQ